MPQIQESLVSIAVAAIAALALNVTPASAQTYVDDQGRVQVALVKQPFVPDGTSVGPTTMANGGIQDQLRELGAVVRVAEIGLTPEEDFEYGGWKRLAFALGHLNEVVAANERDGYFTVGLLGTCPSMPGMVGGFQHSGPTPEAIRSACSGSTRTATSTRRRRRGADRSGGCRSRSRRVAP